MQGRGFGQPTGDIVSDSGFRPETNGFGFANYGVEPGVRDMTLESMIEMFGPAVCVGRQTQPCVLKPNAAQWMGAQNEFMGGGHCYGFSVSALRFFTGRLAPPFYGAPTVPELQLLDNPRVQELIARTQAHAALPSVYRRIFWGTPNQNLAKLERVLADPRAETPAVAVYNDVGGHAVIPYAVEDLGGGRKNVLVYDNNWPGITRAIEFNTKRNSYKYIGAQNPDEDYLTYKGTKRTWELKGYTHVMGLYPASPGFRMQRCWFCGRQPSAGRAGASGRPREFVEINLRGNPANHGHLLIEDAKGRKLGYVGKKLINQIPNAEIIRPPGTHEAPEPTYRLPAGIELTITLDGSPLKRADTEQLSVIGSRELFYVTPIKLRPRQKDRLFLKSGDGIVTYVSDRKFGRNAPAIAAGVTKGSGRTERNYIFAAVSLRPNARSIQLQGDFERGAFGVAGIDGHRGPSRYYTLLQRYTRQRTDNWVAPRLRVDDSELSVALFGQVGGRNSRVPVSIFRTRDLEQVRTEYMKPDRKENRASDREREQGSDATHMSKLAAMVARVRD